MRSCPACQLPLRAMRHRDVEIDRCGQCAGVFYEPGEATALLGPAADPSQWSLGSVALAPSTTSPACPQGHGGMWTYHVEHSSDAVNVHACGTCRGLWLERHAGRTLVEVVRRIREDEAAEGIGEHAPSGLSYVFQAFTGMPVEVWNPVERRPWVLYSLALAISVVFLGQFVLSNSASHQVGRDLLLQFAVVPHELFAGYGLATVITYAFLHAGWMHVLGNLYFLYVFGDNVEDRLGRARFLALYVATAVAGALLYAGVHRDSFTPMVGASGAISGLMGAYIVLFPRARLWVVLFFKRFRISAAWYLAVWAALQVVSLALARQGTAWEAHLGGAACGVLLAVVFRRTEVA